MKILALDQATTTGWAVGDSIVRPIASGSFKIHTSNAGQFAMFWGDKIGGLIKEHDVEFLGFESTWIGPENISTALKLFGLQMMAAYVATRFKLPFASIDNSSWRSAFYPGKWRAPKKHGFRTNTDYYKFIAVEECRRRGWPVQSDDEAEACGIFNYFIKDMHPEMKDQPPLPMEI